MLNYNRLFIGSACNNDCSCCEHKNETRGQVPLAALRERLERRSDDPDSLLLVGGEPTIRQDFLDIVSAALAQGYKRVMVRTNGRVLSDWNAAQAAVNSGVFLYEFKLCGAKPETHDSITERHGSFAETIQGIANIKSINVLNGRPFSAFVAIRVPVTVINYEELDLIVEEAGKFHPDRLVFSLTGGDVPLRVVSRYIKDALDEALCRNIWAVAEGFPYCNMNGYEAHLVSAYGCQEGAYEKGAVCTECAFDPVCDGVPRAFADGMGLDELSPLDDLDLARRVSGVRGGGSGE